MFKIRRACLGHSISFIPPHILIYFFLLVFLSSEQTASAINRIEAISAGGMHTCALTMGGGVKCWGDNHNGQLGDGSISNRLTPVDVSGLTSGVTAIASGVGRTCALTTAGGVKCWGENSSGRPGEGSSIVPVDVPDLSGVTAIATGSAHTCALTGGGGVKCWGLNDVGQLGDGSVSSRMSPVDVSGLTSGVTEIAAGSSGEPHTCALTTEGGVKCWGGNYAGQLGNVSSDTCYSSFPCSLTPVDVSGLTSGVTAIAAGSGYTCALTAGGGVKCWGTNYFGQLGDGSISSGHMSPVDVSGLTSGVTAVAAGYDHACAITTGGGAKCWGYNNNGQLGDGSISNRTTPVDVSGLTSGVTAIAAGGSHTCAIILGSRIKCWGGNASGELGDGSTSSRLTPVDVLDHYTLTGTVTLAATPFAGVTIIGGGLGSQITGTDGKYAFPDILENTSYTLTPQMSGYTFIPSSAGSILADNTIEDFAAYLFTPTPTATPSAEPTVVIKDTNAPSVRALKASGRVGRRLTLTYRLNDASGQSKESIKVKKGKKVLKRLSVRMSAIPASKKRLVKFLPRGFRAGSYSFCVTATDPFGNKSKGSCAALNLK